MEKMNLLEFLNTAKGLRALEYANYEGGLSDFPNILTEDEQFTFSIDLGVIYLTPVGDLRFRIIDGLDRIVTLSLLLHAVCECYKKTTPRNDKAIRTIRKKYLTKTNNTVKLLLNENEKEIYSKIINGERLSGKEKNSKLFLTLHNFWVHIKEDKIPASKIFSMLQKISVTLVYVANVSERDLFYSLHKDRTINQVALISDFMREKKLKDEWQDIVDNCFLQKGDIDLFFRDFFITKFNYKTFESFKLYESFVNFFNTMNQYLPQETIISRIKRSASLYQNMLNINFTNPDIKQAFINIKKHNGEDTYAYLLSVYEDYYSNNISESIFLEILNTVDEYLRNRQNTGKNIDFNELVQYLNAFITCK